MNYARGFREQPIDFLEGLSIRKLNLLAQSVNDLTPVYSLASSSQELRVQSYPHAVLQLERLPRLRTLAASWHQIQGSIMFAPQLGGLSVASYAGSDLAPLGSLSSLASVIMKERPKLLSLEGIEAFPWLAHLGVHWAQNLVDISGLQQASSPILEVLHFPSCQKVLDIASVASWPSLRFFELSEGAEIPAVAPVSDLLRL